MKNFGSFQKIDERIEELEGIRNRIENDNKYASKKRVMVKSLEDGCTITEAKKAARVTTEEWKEMQKDEGFLLELDYAIDSDIRLAKSKVRLGLEKDDCEEFALKYLKAKRPGEFGTQIVNTKNEIRAEVEHKDIDSILVDYYSED